MAGRLTARKARRQHLQRHHLRLPGGAPWAVALTGDLSTVTRLISVTGPGATELTVDRGDRGGDSTVFRVSGGGDLTPTGLTMTGAATACAWSPAAARR
jgi:hypothetical protein